MGREDSGGDTEAAGIEWVAHSDLRSWIGRTAGDD